MQAVEGDIDRNDIEIDFILEYTLSAMIGVVSYWFRQNKVLPAEDLIALMYRLMQNEVINKISN